MTRPKVTRSLSRSNNQPKTKKPNRIAEAIRIVDDSDDFDRPDPSHLPYVLQYAMKVLNACHTDPHPELVSRGIEDWDCQVCFALRLCAIELITLKSHAADALEHLKKIPAVVGL